MHAYVSERVWFAAACLPKKKKRPTCLRRAIFASAASRRSCSCCDFEVSSPSRLRPSSTANGPRRTQRRYSTLCTTSKYYTSYQYMLRLRARKAQQSSSCHAPFHEFMHHEQRLYLSAMLLPSRGGKKQTKKQKKIPRLFRSLNSFMLKY